MGNNLDKLQKVDYIDFPFKKSFYGKQNPNKPYYFQVFEDIDRASPLEKHFLGSQLIDIFKACFPAVTSYDSIISYYFYFSQAKCVYLTFVVDKQTNQIQGFQINILIEEYLEEGNDSEANKYFVGKGLVGIKPEYRQGGLYKEISTLFISLAYKKLYQKNFIYFDLVISPITFYFVQKNCKWIYPLKSNEINSKQMEFFFRLRNRFLFNPVSESNHLLVQAITRLSDSEIQYWRKSYDKLSEEMKFFIDHTNLEKNVGLVYMAAINLIEGNTFGLPAKEYFEKSDFEGELLEHSFNSPKL